MCQKQLVSRKNFILNGEQFGYLKIIILSLTIGTFDCIILVVIEIL